MSARLRPVSQSVTQLAIKKLEKTRRRKSKTNKNKQQQAKHLQNQVESGSKRRIVNNFCVSSATTIEHDFLLTQLRNYSRAFEGNDRLCVRPKWTRNKINKKKLLKST